MLDRQYGYAAAENPTSGLPMDIFTADGGRTWVRATPPCRDKYGYIGGRFSATERWAVCHTDIGADWSPTLLYHSTDGGRTWEVVQSNAADGGMGGALVVDVFFIDEQHGWFSSCDPGTAPPTGFLRGTSDGGRSWVALATTDYSIGRLDFTSPSQGHARRRLVCGWEWEADEGDAIQTSDSGQTWYLIP